MFQPSSCSAAVRSVLPGHHDRPKSLGRLQVGCNRPSTHVHACRRVMHAHNQPRSRSAAAPLLLREDTRWRSLSQTDARARTLPAGVLPVWSRDASSLPSLQRGVAIRRPGYDVRGIVGPHPRARAARHRPSCAPRTIDRGSRRRCARRAAGRAVPRHQRAHGPQRRCGAARRGAWSENKCRRIVIGLLL